MDTLGTAALVAATITTGLAAGLFYTFSVVVMPGLALTDDRTFVHAFQRINVAILNGWFALAFGGSAVLTAAAAALQLREDDRTVLAWTLAALVLYLTVLGITFGLNVPLNNALDAAGDPDKIPDLAAVRERFEATWVKWNHARTLANVAALGCLAWALVEHG